MQVPMTSDTENFTHGVHQMKPRRTVYDIAGAEYEFAEKLSEDRWLVYPIVEIQGWEGEIDKVTSDQPRIMRPVHLYPTAPKPVVDQQVKAVQDQMASLRAEMSTLRAERATFDREELARKDRVKRHEQLAMLDDFISGKIQYAVVKRNGGFEIVAWDELSDNDRRLLSLFGDSRGNLSYKINQHGDGSGFNTDVILFCDHGSALQWLRQTTEQIWAEWRDTGQSSFFNAAVMACRKSNIPIPQEVREKLFENELRRASEEVASAQQQLQQKTNHYQDVLKGGAK